MPLVLIVFFFPVSPTNFLSKVENEKDKLAREINNNYIGVCLRGGGGGGGAELGGQRVNRWIEIEIDR